MTSFKSLMLFVLFLILAVIPYGYANAEEVDRRSEYQKHEEGEKITEFDLFAGDIESSILLEDGTLWRWGHFYRGDYFDYSLGPSKHAISEGVFKIADSLDTTSVNGVIKLDGSLWVWGKNDFFQMGLPEKTTVRSGPHKINIPTKIVSATLGENSIALDENGDVWTWGENKLGQLGDGTAISRHDPYKVEELKDIVQVVSTGTNSHALSAKGEVWSWGQSFHGQIGDELTTHTGPIGEVIGGQVGVNKPIKAVGIPTVKKISAKRDAVLALDEYGDVWTWGRNDNFHVKGDNSRFRILVPTKVIGLSDIVDISMERSYAIALKEDGTVWSWGYNGRAVLGDGVEDGNNHKNPSKVLIDKKVVKISTSKLHVLALDENGKIWSWGEDYHRQLGTYPHLHYFLETADYRQDNRITIPQTIEFLKPIKSNVNNLRLKEKENVKIKTAEALFAGNTESWVLKKDGSVVRWGNFYNPNLVYSLRSEKIELVDKVVKIPESLDTSQNQGVIKEDGSLWVWGRNQFQQLGLEEITSNFTTIPVKIQIPYKVKDAIIGTNSIALDENGDVWTWGENRYGTVGDGSSVGRRTPYKVEGLSNIVHIASSGMTNHALDSNGQVWSWGYNNFKTVGNAGVVGATTKTPVKSNISSNVKMISSKDGAVLALDENGNVWTWGSTRNFNIAGDGTLTTYIPLRVYDLSNVVKISLEERYALALKEDGSLWSWGFNSDYVLGRGGLTNEKHPPQKVMIDKKVVDFSTSADHVLAVDTDGYIWSWGEDYHRKLGSYPYLWNNSAANNYARNDYTPQKIDIIRLGINEDSEIEAPKLTGLPASELIAKKDYDKIDSRSLEADPIDTATGALISSNRVLSTNGEVPLSFSINYNSLLPKSNILGNGWYHNHYGFIEKKEDTLKYYTDSNSYSEFTKNDNGKYYNESKKYSINYIEETNDGYTLVYKNGSKTSFNSEGYMIEHKNIKETIYYSYEGNNLKEIKQVVNGKETVFNLSYENNLLTKVQYKNKSIDFTYDENSNLVEFSDLNKNKTIYEYNSESQIIASKNALGHYYMKNTYDQFGRVLKQFDAKDNVTTFEYKEYENSTMIETKVTNREGHVRTLIHNASYQLIKEINSDNEESINKYDENGNFIEVVDFSGLISKFEYDQNSNLIKTIDSLNRVEEFTYDEFNNLISTTDMKGNVRTYEYDSNNLLVKATAPNGLVIDYQYLNGLLVKEITSAGATTSYEYDGGFITKSIDAEGNPTLYRYEDNKVIRTDSNGNVFIEIYDNNNNLIKLIDPYDNETVYEYDGLNQLVKTVYSNGLIELIEYDSNGNIVKKTKNNIFEKFTYNKDDKLSSVFSKNNYESGFDYNAFGLLVKEVNGEGLVTEYTYNTSGKVLVKKVGDRLYKYEYDKYGRLISEVNPENQTVTYSYDEYDRLISSKNPKGGITYYEYNQFDYLIKETDPNGSSNSFEYDEFGNKVKEIDSKGKATLFEYDKLNNLVKVTDNQGNTTSFEYDGNSNLIKEVNALGNVTLYKFDKLNRLVETKNALGNTSTIAYDSMSNVSELKDAYGNIVNIFTYDLNGNLIISEDALGNKTKYEYDKESNVTQIIDSLNRKTKYDYNSYAQVVKKIDAAGVESTNNYNSFGELIGYKDPNTNQTTYTHNKVGLITNELNATNNDLKYEYDNLNAVKKATNARGDSIHYEYDLMGILLKETSKENEITYTYDSNYNLTQVNEKVLSTGKTKTIKRTYDSLNRLVKYTDIFGNSIEYIYDSVGNVISMKYPNGKAVNYMYDAVNNLVEVSDWNGNQTTYSYDKNNRLLKTLNGNGTYENREYDLKGQLTKLTHYKSSSEVLESIKYTYNSVGNLTSENEKKYTYDVLNRVISATEKKYSYDAAGNILEVTNSNPNESTNQEESNAEGENAENGSGSSDGTGYPGVAVPIEPNGDMGVIEIEYPNKVVDLEETTNDTASVEEDNSLEETVLEETETSTNGDSQSNASSNEPSEIDSNINFAYGADNRIDSYEDIQMNLDADGNLISIPTNNEVLTGVYNSRNQLISLGEETYTYDAEGRRISVSNGSNETRFVYNSNTRLDQLLMETDSNGNPTKYYVYGLGLISQESVEGEVSTYHYDKRGSTIFLTNELGEKVNTYEYDVYGEILSSDETVSNRFLYNGQYGVQTDDSGLYFMRNRYYSPEIKRFINRDVIQGDINDSQTYNRFAYVNGNPLNYVDPFGLSKESDSFVTGVYNFFIGDDINALFDPNASALDKVWATVSIGSNFIPGGGVAFKGVKALVKGGKAIGNANKAKKASKLVECPMNCFVAGTLVLTKKGHIPVEDIEIGDLVLAKDDETGELAYKEVVDLFNRQAEVIYTIFVGGEEISVTGEHPFWVEGKGWVETADLEVGDILTNFNGQPLPIKDILIKEELTTVYNFEVEDFHTYFVSKLSIWTHNCYDPKVYSEKIVKNVKDSINANSRVPNKKAGGSTTLSKSLERAKINRPDNSAAHHIVMINGKDAESSRLILEKLHIDINSAANGVYLPRAKVKTTPGKPTTHSGSHSDEDFYISKVNSLVTLTYENNKHLSLEKQQEEVVKSLHEVRKWLLNGQIRLNHY